MKKIKTELLQHCESVKIQDYMQNGTYYTINHELERVHDDDNKTDGYLITKRLYTYEDEYRDDVEDEEILYQFYYLENETSDMENHFYKDNITGRHSRFELV